MKKSTSNRRDFLFNSSKVAMAVGLSTTIIPSLANSINKKIAPLADTRFIQQPLLYKLDSLQTAIDTQTMEIHYTKHAATYCKNLNEAYIAEVGSKNKSLEDILNKISKYSLKMRNNAGGHYNHEMFWQCLTPNATKPSDKLTEKIIADFGSFEAFKTQFNDAAKTRFGSGWAWLVKSKDGKLSIGSTANQDNPLMNIVELKGKPLLCLDVWEHAYYLRYQNKRGDYINNWWSIIDWNFVEKKMSED
ncbi:MAG: superoxide dismutase [Chitinophagaceae bacterium]